MRQDKGLLNRAPAGLDLAVMSMIILASQSKARRALLTRAGVSFTALSPDYDEDAAKRQNPGLDGTALASLLATGKALAVSQQQPDAAVIGADQTLSCDGRLYDKPGSRSAARQQLLELRGRTHVLASAAALVRNGSLLWSTVEEARITFRSFSEAALDSYLDEAGEDILFSVGAYHYEGIGLRLMERVEGSDHVILGLPVLPLLACLRAKGFIAP